MGINPRNLKYRISTTPAQSAATVAFIFTGFIVGHWVDRNENNRLVRFRDKSMLYGKPKSEAGDAPSWGGDYWSFCK